MQRQGSPSSIGHSIESGQRPSKRAYTPYAADIILQRANAFASARYGLSLTARQLRRMVDSGLVPGPKPHGRRRGMPPQWRWSPLSYRRVLQVCRMNKRGIRRTSAIILNLWLDGAAYQFSAVQGATVSEFRRLRKAMSRRIPATWDPRVEGNELTPRSRAAVLKSLGSEQPAFPVFSSEVLLQLAGTALFGTQTGRDAIFSLFPAYGLPNALIDELKSGDLIQSDLELGVRMLAGLRLIPRRATSLPKLRWITQTRRPSPTSGTTSGKLFGCTACCRL